MTSLKRTLVLIVFAALGGGVAVLLHPGGGSDACDGLAADSAFYHRSTPYDPGTIHIFIKNDSLDPKPITRVLMDGLPVPVWGLDRDWRKSAGLDTTNEGLKAPPITNHTSESAKSLSESASRFSGQRIYWARFTGAPLLPGTVGELRVKMTHPLSRPVRFTFVQENAEDLLVTVRPEPPTIRICALTFAASPRKAYAYLENMSDVPDRVVKVEVNGEIAAKGGWQFGNTPAGGKGVVAVELPDSLAAGEAFTVKCYFASGRTSQAQLRVVTGFPMTNQFGSPPPDSGLDKGVYTWQPSYMKRIRKDVKAPEVAESSLNANLLADCPLCANGLRGTKWHVANEILRRNDICREFDPHHPNIVHACRVRAEQGYVIFGTIADILSFNPSVRTTLTPAAPGESPQATVRRMATVGRLSASPCPFLCMADTSAIGSGSGAPEEYATPGEFRRRVWTMIGCGAKGLLYRHHGWNRSSPSASALNPSLRPLNAEIRQIRDFLAIGEPVDWSTVDSKSDYDAYTLLAGDKGVILILVRKGTETRLGEKWDPPAIRIGLRFPPWLELEESMMRVTPVGLSNGSKLTASDNVCEAVLPGPKDANAWLLRTRRRGGE